MAEVLDRVRSIPPGHVAAYGDVTPGAPRWAGRVLALSLERGLPWWRVVRADGTLAKGERQAALLLAEGVPLRGGSGGAPRVDVRAARWARFER